MRIGVAILTWNRTAKLSASLESVKAQTRPADEIVVVDSASTDDTCAMLHRRFSGIRLVRLHRNMGCPEGRNLALANCNTDIIYSLDDDGQLHPRCLEIVEQVFAERPRAGIVASKIIRTLSPSPDYLAAQLGRLPRRTVRFSGGASAIRREILNTAGYYPHDFWRQSEEADLTLRVLDAGFEGWYAPAAIMFHPSGYGSTSTALYYSTLNTLRSVVRLCPARYLLMTLTHQLAKFAMMGVRGGNLVGVMGGVGRWMASLPVLVAQRCPVRPETMREFLRLRREYFEYQKGQESAGTRYRVRNGQDTRDDWD